MLILLAALCLGAALLYPTWSVRDFQAQVDDVIADVEALRAAARSVREDTNTWPTAAPPGQTPAELAGLGGEDGVFLAAEYTLGWAAWAVVDSVEARPEAIPASADDAPRQTQAPRMEPVVRSVGAVIVHSGNEDLLAELLEHYQDGSSLVLDTMWMLILPERAQAIPAR